MTMTRHWIEVGTIDDIAPLGARVIRRPGTDIAVIRAEDDKIYAIDNKCPHKGGPLSDGIVHGCRITCPLHNWVLELDSGVAIAPDEGKAATHPVKLEGRTIFVQLDD